MRVVVVGLGSMGKRRIRLLKQYRENIEIIGIDFQEERRKEVEELFDLQTGDDLEYFLKGKEIDAVFVSTAPLSHNKIIHTALSYSCHVFTEINLVSDGYEENMKLAHEKGVELFLSSTFLYREEIKYIREQLSILTTQKLNYIYHVGQYLPDWHPWENYKDFFVGKKETNACREIMAIDMPWLVNVFGKIKNIQVMKHKTTALDIDYPDTYFMLIEHENGNKGSFQVDVVSRKAVRNLEIYNEDVYFQWDGSPEGLSVYDVKEKKSKKISLYHEIEQRKEYSSFVIENAYFSEIQSFFDVMKKKKQTIYSFEDDLEILNWIDRIEEVNNTIIDDN